MYEFRIENPYIQFRQIANQPVHQPCCYISSGTGNGIFKPNELYYKYYITESPFMRKECLECQLMPSCLYSQSCLQKKIENFYPKCDKNKIMKSIEDIISYKINFKLTKAR